ncbi:DUF6787 family protein [Ancylomarina longa]|uniref:Diacylglyceryl transferase n=1 Tax=Ancylomarina longa TaxID=2487017 RepID=A0A434AU98_9BACT|nr:DUF6787 family protein [Ancylomarina longa]RUT77917.1 diacylglyceryl transferase [Ancylomarina longa]
MFEKLKRRWGVTSNIRLVLIFIAFSVTGSLAVTARKFVFEYLSIGPDTNLIIKIVLSILIITPSYQVLLIIVGSLLGQFEFFWRFEKKMLGRFLPKKKSTPTP